MAERVVINIALADIDPATRSALLHWHKNNPQVWKEFEKFALEAAQRGRRVGAKALGERIRWESEIVRGEDYKCNNNYLAYLARVFTAKYPEHREFFEFREIKGLRAA